eukprot:7289591-Prymnesium_polylepis.1
MARWRSHLILPSIGCYGGINVAATRLILAVSSYMLGTREQVRRRADEVSRRGACEARASEASRRGRQAKPARKRQAGEAHHALRLSLADARVHPRSRHVREHRARPHAVLRHLGLHERGGLELLCAGRGVRPGSAQSSVAVRAAMRTPPAVKIAPGRAMSSRSASG